MASCKNDFFLHPVAIHFNHVNAEGTSHWNKTHYGMNVPLSLQYHINSPFVRNHFCSLELYILQKLPGQKNKLEFRFFSSSVYYSQGTSSVPPKITLMNLLFEVYR